MTALYLEHITIRLDRDALWIHLLSHFLFRRTGFHFSGTCSRCLVPESRDANLRRQAEEALWQSFFMAAPEQRREFEPNSKRRKRRRACWPGDDADNGLRSQYALIATTLRMLSKPIHIIPGDHDKEQASLQAFYEVLAPCGLPRAETIRGARCLFMDISGPGQGGPDFRLGSEQTLWLQQELQIAHSQGETALVFMHSYPDDLKGDGEARALTNLISAHDVALIDMGHTHYNELANDGRTVFAATRSTGQIEEGPVGYSIATIDGGVVSWRFKALDDPCPFVVITSPADHRLMRHPGHAIDGSCEVRALVFGARPIKSVACLLRIPGLIPDDRGPRVPVNTRYRLLRRPLSRLFGKATVVMLPPSECGPKTA